MCFKSCYGLLVVVWARLAQLVEHQTFNLRVKGSSPLSGATSFLFFFFFFFFFFFLSVLFPTILGIIQFC